LRNYIDLADHDDLDYLQILHSLQINTKDDRGARSENNVKLHTTWMHEKLLNKKSSKILDLGCGIGLYSKNLAKHGHSVIGVDISPYAIEHAEKENFPELDCSYIQSNILELQLNITFDLIIFPYSIFNTLSLQKRELFFSKICGFLTPSGKFYFEGLRYSPEISSNIFISEDNKLSEIFPNGTKLVVNDHVWNKIEKKLSIYSYAITKQSNIQKSVIKLYYYSHSDYRKLLSEYGFNNIEFLPNPPGTIDNDGLPYESILASL
jgi:2-polyprenyl-3-methyl-5-hydroxy-6-metoxy-1,4-benzoquinol methylase